MRIESSFYAEDCGYLEIIPSPVLAAIAGGEGMIIPDETNVSFMRHRITIK